MLSSALSSTPCRSGALGSISGPTRSRVRWSTCGCPTCRWTRLSSATAALPTGSNCTRPSQRPRSGSTTRGSSSTTQGWQSGSDHPARATRGGELLAPVLRADDDGDDLGPAEAVVADAGGGTGLDQMRQRVLRGQRVARVAEQGKRALEDGQQLVGVGLAHGSHQIGGRGRQPGDVAEGAVGEAERQRVPDNAYK